ncbi:MAG: hypothetical protein AABX98_00395, partial [Nanoarchaeota archaeon]
RFMEEMKRLTVYAYTALQLEVTTREKIKLAQEKATAEAQIEIERIRRESEEARYRFQEMVGDVNRAVGLKNDHLHAIKNRGLAIRSIAGQYLIENRKTDDSIERIITQAIEIEALAREGMKAQLSTTKEELPFDTVLNNVLRIVEPIYRNTVLFERQYESTTTIHGDRKYIEAALANLIENAAYESAKTATKEYPGKVVIRAELLPTDHRTFTRIIINQSGHLSEEIAERLNNGESFSTKGKEGSGIGAQSSKTIITDIFMGCVEYIAGDNRYDGEKAIGGSIEITL